jgi:hypothetical protein
VKAFFLQAFFLAFLLTYCPVRTAAAQTAPKAPDQPYYDWNGFDLVFLRTSRRSCRIGCKDSRDKAPAKIAKKTARIHKFS